MAYQMPGWMQQQYQNSLAASQRDPNQEAKIQFLYDLARANPSNAGLAESYLNSYMGYKYAPQEQMFNPYAQNPQNMLGGMGDDGGIDVPDDQYDAFKQSQGSEDGGFPIRPTDFLYGPFAPLVVGSRNSGAISNALKTGLRANPLTQGAWMGGTLGGSMMGGASPEQAFGILDEEVQRTKPLGTYQLSQLGRYADSQNPYANMRNTFDNLL